MASAKQPQRLLILANTPGNIGGMERTAVNLTRLFTQRDYQTRCIVPQTEKVGRLLAWCQEQGIDVEAAAIYPSQTEPYTVATMLRLRQQLAAWHPNAVSFHYPFYLSLRDALAVRLAGVRRCVATIHGVPEWPEWHTSRHRKMTVLASHLLDTVIVHSRPVEQALLAAGIPASKIIHFPLGLPPPHHAPTKAAARARLGLPADAFIIGTHARLDPVKGVAGVIEAVEHLPADADGPLLLIAGVGPLREELEALAAARLGSRARMLGQLSRDELADFYTALDVFALAPVWQEAFGLVYIEAAQCGTPAVAWRVGGVAYTVLDGETGLLVENQDTAALAQAIGRLRADPTLRARLGAQAQARAASEFTEARMADNYAAALHLPRGASLAQDSALQPTRTPISEGVREARINDLQHT